MNLPFIQFDLGPHDSYKEPYYPAGFVETKDIFDDYLKNHENDCNAERPETTNNKFPHCCLFHKFIFDDVKEGLDNFPNETDKEFLNNPRFKIENYQGLPIKITTAIFITQFHIEKTINSIEWYDLTTEYIDYVVDSFGYPALFYHYYLHYSNEHSQKFDIKGFCVGNVSE
jgi:hypothetical protein